MCKMRKENKLLHERLRGWAADEEPMREAHLGMGTVSRSSLFRAFAGEIERYYIPISCDPDGRPWKIGDDCITAEGEEATIVGYRGNGRVFIDLHDERCYARCYASDLKRPQTKVLDANGVPIKVGDTVWSTDPDTREYARVVAVRDGLVDLLWSDGEVSLSINPSDLSHKDPYDSLEKLRDDMAAYADGGISCIEDDLHMFADRLSALIERGA